MTDLTGIASRHRAGVARVRLPVRVDYILTRAQLYRHRLELIELYERTAAPLSTSWDAMDTWFKHHPDTWPWAVLLRRGTDRPLIGAAVLAREIKVGAWKIGPAGVEGEPTHLAAVDPETANYLGMTTAWKLGASQRPWRLRLTDLPAGDPVALDLVNRMPFAELTPGADTPILTFDGSPLNTYLSKNTRSAVAKARNRISNEGHSSELAVTSNVASHLPAVVALHQARNLQLRGESRLDEPYFRDLVLRHADAGRVRLFTLVVDDQLAAFALCFLHNGALWAYANMAHPDWLHFSPGAVVNAEVVRWAHANAGSLDWGAGVQRYKMSGSVQLRPSETLDAWSSWSMQTATAIRRGRLDSESSDVV